MHFVSRASGMSALSRLGGYFGHLYPLHERLLVADAERLHCFDRNGSIVWQSTELGIDGVVVSGVADGVIEGEGEWDPPGRWQRFRMLLSSGTFVQRPFDDSAR